MEDLDHILTSDPVEKFINFNMWFQQQQQQDDSQTDTVHSKSLPSINLTSNDILKKACKYECKIPKTIGCYSY